jgi:outer membrane biosynthesis protein TonB
MTSFRSFDTVLSYNNSAVGIYWPKVSLHPEEEARNVFYLSLAADEAVPGGAAYILAKDQAAQEAEAAVAAEEEGDAGAEEQTAVEEEMPVQNIEAVKEKLTEPKAEQTPAKEEPKTEPVNVAAVEETPEPKAPETKTPEVKAQEPKTEEPKGSTITDDMLTGDYIQKLLNRIEELEEGDPELNKREINELNAQLDAIITILNSKNQ